VVIESNSTPMAINIGDCDPLRIDLMEVRKDLKEGAALGWTLFGTKREDMLKNLDWEVINRNARCCRTWLGFIYGQISVKAKIIRPY
jgi:hypothetical protein